MPRHDKSAMRLAHAGTPTSAPLLWMLDMDLGVSGFYGTAREPRFRLIGSPSAPTGFAPVYERVFQIGVDAQLIHEGLERNPRCLAQKAHEGRARPEQAF